MTEMMVNTIIIIFNIISNIFSLKNFILIKFQIFEKGVIRYIDVTADQDQLQDLMYKVKDAVKQTDRLIDNLTK